MESEVDKVKIALEKDTFDKLVTMKHAKPTDRVGRDGFTLIHWACFYGRVEVLKHFLLTICATKLVSVVDKHGWTPLHICAIKGQDKCLQLLIENGGDVLIKEHRGYTCGHCAATHGHTLALQYILNAGYDIIMTDARSWTVVHHAAFFGQHQTLQMLAQLGGDLLNVDLKGNSPAHLSASEGHLDCLKLLVYHDNTPLLVLKARNNKGETPKDLSIQFQKPDCADYLASAVKQEENNDENYEEEYPAHYAASTGNLHVLTTLISEGHWDINETDKTGSAPAHKAAGGGEVKCLQWLINNGADLSLNNNLKETMLDVAKKHGKTQCVAMIEEGIGLEQSCNYESIEQARLKIVEFEKMLELSKKTYQQLGGTLEEEDKHEKQIRDMKERHTIDLSDLRNKLELEREKRETLEREADVLRLKLHQANDTLLHYKTLVPSTNNQTVNSDVSSFQNKQKQRRRTQSAVTTNKRTGGAYIDLKPL